MVQVSVQCLLPQDSIRTKRSIFFNDPFFLMTIRMQWGIDRFPCCCRTFVLSRSSIWRWSSWLRMARSCNVDRDVLLHHRTHNYSQWCVSPKCFQAMTSAVDGIGWIWVLCTATWRCILLNVDVTLLYSSMTGSHWILDIVLETVFPYFCKSPLTSEKSVLVRKLCFKKFTLAQYSMCAGVRSHFS